MAFNNFPYTNFQDLNLGWILAKIKEALTRVVAVEARADSVEADVATYSDRIDHAIGEADSARDIANLARQEAGNAQSDATSGIAIGQAAQAAANAAAQTANGAVDTANSAYSLANDANYAATVAGNKADSAVEDYLQVNINIYPSSPATSDKNVDQILTAYTDNKKIRFELEDSRTGLTYVSYDFAIKPDVNTSTDLDIEIVFDASITGSAYNAIVVTLHKVVASGTAAYSVSSIDVAFSGGSGSASAVLFTAQTLTTAQKSQARTNIAAGHYNIGVSQDETLMTIVNLESNQTNTYAINKPQLPTVTSSNAGAFLRVNSSGVWVADSVPIAENTAFGD